MNGPRHMRAGDEPVPGYRLVRVLGRGANGEVWEAAGPGDVKVALKFVDLGERMGVMELRALRRVKDCKQANLMPIFAFWMKDAAGKLIDEPKQEAPPPSSAIAGTAVMPAFDSHVTESKIDAKSLIIAMQLGDRSLFERLRECKGQGLEGIPAEELLGYMEEASKAIDALNGNGNAPPGSPRIQHCDIKPQNIILVGSSAQVCDYGLARVVGDARTTMSAFGTVAYAPPELLCTPAKETPRTDQYSLAIAYIELRTGKLPYEKEEFFAILEQVRNGKLTFPSSLTKGETAVLKKATSKDYEQRYESAGEFVRDLKRSFETPQAAVPKKTIAAVGVLLVAVSVGVAALIFRPEKQVDPMVEARAHLAKAQSSYQSQQYDESLKETESALQLAPRLAEAATLQILNRLALKKEPFTFNELEVAITAEPENAEALSRRAQIHENNQHPDLAIIDLTAALKSRPDAKDYLRRSRLYDKRKTAVDDKRALDDLNRAIELDPNSGDAIVQRALTYRKLKNYEGALADFSKLLTLDPLLVALDPGYDPEEAATLHRLRAGVESQIASMEKAVEIDEKIAEQFDLLTVDQNNAAARGKVLELRQAHADATKK